MPGQCTVCCKYYWRINEVEAFSCLNFTLCLGLPFSSVAQLCLTFCDPMDCQACQASLSITNSQSLLKLMSIKSVMPSNHLILCRPLLFRLSQHQGLFQWVSSNDLWLGSWISCTSFPWPLYYSDWAPPSLSESQLSLPSEGLMRAGQTQEVLPRSCREKLKLGTEGDRGAKDISTSSTWESRTAVVSPKEMGT